MINLLDEPLPANEIEPLLPEYEKSQIFPPTTDPFWKQQLSDPTLQKILSPLLEHPDDESPLLLTDALYADYRLTGDRRNFEIIYFARRQALACAGLRQLTHCPPLDADNALIRNIEDTLSEESWALPAHVSNPTGKEPLRIDLFCGETAFTLAACAKIFALPPELTSRFRARLNTQIFENYLADSGGFYWTSPEHIYSRNNWNAVCHHGVIGAALLLEADTHLVAQMLEKASVHLPHFLEGFSDDGACLEGPSYWEYGFGWFAMLNELLEKRSSGQLSLFSGSQKVHAIGNYGPALSSHTGEVFAFSDSSRGSYLRPSILNYLGERLSLPSCQRLASANYQRLAKLDRHDDRTDVTHLLHLIRHKPDIHEISAPQPGSHLFPDAEIWVARSAPPHRIEVAAKGGHNAELHNHNDVGNFIIFVDGTPFLDEIGRAEYNKNYFGPRRYENLATRSKGHSLPIINGQEQSPGGTSKQFSVSTQGNKTRFELELSGCYPPESNCHQFLRQIHFDQQTGVLELCDDVHLGSPFSFESGFITHCPKIEIASERVAIISSGERALQLETNENSYWDRVESLSYQSPKGNSVCVSRLVVKPCQLAEHEESRKAGRQEIKAVGYTGSSPYCRFMDREPR